ncbi:MAG: DUF4493 domain-containing protein [Bacteroidales bacterium]|nr:DUF4493 domain-containing protein [Bacteroidales bacterium]
MMKISVYILLLISLVACSGENILDDKGQEGKNVGRFELALSGGASTRAVTSVITKEEADNFLITIYKGTDVFRATAALKDIDTKLPAGLGYSLTAENCSASVAESSNSGWGQRHYKGQSDAFVIKPGETTRVSVSCPVVNAGLCVVFDDSFINYYTKSYKVTTDDARALVFDKANQAVEGAEGELVSGSIAYYNTDDAGLCPVDVVIAGQAGSEEPEIKSGQVTLKRGKITRLTVRKSGTPDETGDISVSISYDDTFSVIEEDCILE